MTESTSPYSRTETSPLTGPSSLGSTIDPQGLSTVPEVPSQSVHYHGNESLDNALRSAIHGPGDSHNGSVESSIGYSYDGKHPETPPQHLRHTASPGQAAGRAWQHSEGTGSSLQNGHGNHREMRSNRLSTKAISPKKEKRGGVRNTLRRMFGRKSTRDRISAPNPTVYPRHDPNEFITSATDIKAKRIASMPVPDALRTSGLSSHPPNQDPQSPPPSMKAQPPPPPKRPPPEQPQRPRRASVPGFMLSKQDTDAEDDAVAGMKAQIPREQHEPDEENIGFAVTNGSNPKRRSRSVGDARDLEHRMSPIQWRRLRRRSDEIRYWRASSDLVHLGERGQDSPVMAQKADNDADDEVESAHEDHNGDFNFGLQENTLHDQERIGLEERIVTLEIKLMDFEYALSKMQAETSLPLRRHSQPPGVGERQQSSSSYASDNYVHTSVEPSLSTPRGTPTMTSSQWFKETTPRTRPISVATTFKAGHGGQSGVPRKESLDQSVRSSLATLTIDHYTTLITLLRNEQSARRRLEQQVSILQGRLDAFSPPHSSHSQLNTLPQQSHSHSRSLSSSQRRQGYIDLRGGKQMSNTHPSVSSYSTNESDTDDDAFHDAYVTPNITPSERGEYERGAFDRIPGVEEGMCF
ncbi:hypothetical protein ACLMJK_006841 [Lecanora helva]